MATYITPVVTLTSPDTITAGGNQSITMPAGTWYLLSIQTVAAGVGTVTVSDATPNTFVNAQATAAAPGVRIQSLLPDVPVVGPLTVAAGAEDIYAFSIELISADGHTLTVA